MIKFFRKIRKNLLTENKFSKYLIYAIGEILLVVVGILIALQINNWNEIKKEDRLEIKYLKGIKRDLKRDIESIDNLIASYSIPMTLMKSIEPTMALNSKFRLKNIDTTSRAFSGLFRRRQSFQSANGTYNSLISDGKSSLIKNEILFDKIQEIYNLWPNRLDNIYDTLKDRESKIVWEYAFEKANWNYKKIIEENNKKMNLDLANLWEIATIYCVMLNRMKIKEVEILRDIDKELESKYE